MKWSVLLLFMTSLGYSMTPVVGDYSTEQNRKIEMDNIFKSAQDEQFEILSSTPPYVTLKDGQMKIYKSSANATTVNILLRAGNTIYALVQGGGGTTINNLGGAGGMAIFDGSVANQVSTAAFPGASIAYGTSFATVTYMPAINSTYTWALAQFNTSFSSISNLGISTKALADLLSQRTVVASDEGGTPGAHVQQFDFVGAGVSYSQTAGTGTVTISGGTTNNFASGFTIVVGTCATYGAQIVGTKTEVWQHAIDTLTARGGGTVLVQPGYYYYNSTVTIPNMPIGMVFLDSAAAVWRDTERIGTVLNMRGGSITNLQVDIATDVYVKSHTPVLDVNGPNCRVNKSNFNVIINTYIVTGGNPGDYYNGFVRIGTNCIDCMVDLNVSSFTTINRVGGGQSGTFLKVAGGTRTVINLNNFMTAQTQGNISNEALIEIVSCDGLTMKGGNITTSRRLIQIGGYTGQIGIVNGFSWKDALVYNYANPHATGLYYIFSSQAGMTNSTGTEISGHRVIHMANVSNPTFAVDNLVPGNTAPTAGIIFSNNSVIYTNPASNPVTFSITNQVSRTLITNNSMWGSALTQAITDTALETRYFNRGNTLNGKEQNNAPTNSSLLRVNGLNVSSLTFTTDFSVTNDGVAGATVAVNRGSTGTWTAAQTFSTMTARYVNSSTFAVSGDNIFYATSTQAGFNNQALVGYVILVGSVTALGAGGTQVVSFPNFSSIVFPQVTENRTDAEANQIHLSAVTANSFTIKNESALNAKDVFWWALGKR